MRGKALLACRGASIALDIAKGIHFLHSHKIMHLDIKSPNILLAADGTAKIADVGLSCMFTLQSLYVEQVICVALVLCIFVLSACRSVSAQMQSSKSALPNHLLS